MYVLIISSLLFLFIFFTRKKKNNSVENKCPNEFISLNKETFNNKEKVSILTYNILVQKFVKSKKIHYNYRKSVSLNTRINKILNEILSLDPDIICLQEVLKENLNKYLNQGLKDYHICFAENTGSNFLNITGFKKAEFKLLEEKSINLDLKRFEFIDNILFGNRGIFKITLSRNNKKYVVYNVHFPWRPQFEFHKCVMANFIFEDILKEDYSQNCCIFIGGDFNSLPTSYVLKLFYNDFSKEYYNNTKVFNNEKLINYFNEIVKNADNIYRSFRIKSVYDNYQIDLEDCKENDLKFNYVKNHPLFTNFTESFCGNIDYIFYSSNLLPLKILKLPSLEEAKSEGFFPSTKFPSDHIKLFAQFQLLN
jgi:CCR4-NOT transcription complex subunit 6